MNQDRVHSVEEIRRWFRGKFKGLGERGKNISKGLKSEFPGRSVARVLNVPVVDLYSYVSGARKIPVHRQRTISRFICDWERGLLEFRPVGQRHKMMLFHRATPKPMPVRFVLDWQKSKLHLIARPPAAHVMPRLRDGFKKV